MYKQRMNYPNRQTDLFAAHPDLFDGRPKQPATPEPEAIRVRLHAMRSEARAAERMPWDARQAKVNGIIFHQMANWLPEPERDTLRAAFVQELVRLGRPG